MVAKTDDLLGLFSICEGTVSIQANPHRCGGESVIDWLASYRDRDTIPSIQKLEMIETGVVVSISYQMDRFGVPFHVYGGSVKQAAFRAYSLAKQILGKLDFSFELKEDNATAMVEELVMTCRAEVYINMNDFKLSEWGDRTEHGQDRNAADWFKNEKEICPDDYTPDCDGDVAFPEELVQQCIKANTVFDVHFYPLTSVGFYRMLYSEPLHVLKRAVEVAKEDVKLSEIAEAHLVPPPAGSGFGTPVVNVAGFDNVNLNGGWKP